MVDVNVTISIMALMQMITPQLKQTNTILSGIESKTQLYATYKKISLKHNDTVW